MARKARENPWGSLVVGLSILACGLVFWLDHLGRLDAGDVLRWWPVALIAMGLAQLPQRQWVSAALWLAIGTIFILPLAGYRTIAIWRLIGIWPLLLSAAGLTLIMQALRPGASRTGLHALAFMGGNIRQIGTPDFTGGDVIAVMGACEIDLSSARMRQEATLDVLAFWGGIEVRIPRGWRVVSRTTTILGDYSDHTDGGPAAGPALVIRGSVIMGGLEVKNVREGRP